MVNSRIILFDLNILFRVFALKIIYKRFTLRALFSILFIFSFILSYPTTYYISNTGSDSNSGLTPDMAWKTLNKVNSYIFQPGDQILFKCNEIFFGELIIKNSGTSGNPITYGAYGTGRKPVITGFSTVSGWTNEGGGIYSTIISSSPKVNVVTIDSVQYAIGRYPNAGIKLAYESCNTNVSITDNELPASPDWTGAEAVIYKNGYTIDRCIITGHSLNTLYYTSLGTTRNARPGLEYFIQNDLRTLDNYGEWYYDSGATKLYVFFGEIDPGTKVTKVSTINNLLTNTGGYDYITINGIDFEGSNGSSVYFKSGADYCTFMNCSIAFSGYNGFELSGTNQTVINNSVSYCNGGGILINGANALVKHNNLAYIGCIEGQSNMIVTCIGMTLNANNPTVQYNSLDHVAYMGIYFTVAAKTGTIQFNLVNYPCQLLNDSGGIYMGHDHPNTLIDHNIVVNSGGNGIYLDESCTGVTASNNTVAHCRGSGIKLHKSHDNIINSNTCFDNGIGINLENWVNEDNLRNNNITSNIVIAKTASQIVFSYIQRYPSYNFGVGSDNCYARPVDDSLTFQVNYMTAGNLRKTLSEWKTLTGQDNDSKKSPILKTYQDPFLFEYNSDTIIKILSLEYPMIEGDGKRHSNNYTLQPYSSVILMKDDNPSGYSENLNNVGELEIFPNPCNGKVTVRFTSRPDFRGGKIEILDLSGRKITSRLISGTSEDFNLGNQPAGIYLIVLKAGKDLSINKMIVN